MCYAPGRDQCTVDARSNLKCYWTRASCDCGRLQIDDVTREVNFLFSDYTNPKTLTMTLNDAFESFCATSILRLCTEQFLHRRRCNSHLVCSIAHTHIHVHIIHTCHRCIHAKAHIVCTYIHFINILNYS